LVAVSSSAGARSSSPWLEGLRASGGKGGATISTSPAQYLLDGITLYLSELPEDEWQALKLRARGPEDPNPADSASRHLEAA
jgi:hypothetical protein